MNRPIPILAVAATFVLAACGGTASAAKNTASPTPGAGNAFRNGASGQLVQISPTTLILTGPNGDTTVTYTSATTITKTSIATLADIAKGTCVLANGQKDASGLITATTVLISPRTATGCAARNFGPPSPAPGSSPRPSFSPRPNATPRPSGQPNNGAFVTGEVTAQSGPSLTVLTQANGTQKIVVSSAATITESSSVSESALQNGECIRANGSRDTSGDVQATAITITPAGPSGTCNSGFGGGFRGPGAGGGAPGAGGGG
jgi:Domain of unknown function (DUF5666)